MSDTVNEGDLSSNEQGSCARKNGGKVSFSLLPLHLLAGVCRVLRFGLQKYAAWNWAKGSDWSQSFDCTLRHLLRWWYMCEENDKESGLHHIDHAICNLLFIRHNILTYQAGDDRPPVEVTRFDLIMDFFDAPWTYEDDVPVSEDEITDDWPPPADAVVGQGHEPTGTLGSTAKLEPIGHEYWKRPGPEPGEPCGSCIWDPTCPYGNHKKQPFNCPSYVRKDHS